MLLDHSAQAPVLEAWQAALDRLEADLARVEQALEGGAPVEMPDWTAPALPPLPATLREQAADLQRRQREVLAVLGERLAQTARQQGVVAGVERATGHGPSRPAYIDVTA